MSDVERDPLVRRAIDELQQMPAADAAAIRRVVAAAAAARVTPADDEPLLASPRRRPSRYWPVAGIAAAAAIAGFALSTVWRSNEPAAAPTAMASQLALQPAANGAAEALPIAQQFVFNSRTAQSVSVVGDFNKWNASSARMTRASDPSLWSVTIPIAPGRHVYGFMVDDSLFVLDPRAPKVRDRELGADGSVIIVGKP
jgi:hypothetical protein